MNTVTIEADRGTHRIPRHHQGQFAEHLGRCVYEGLWVGPESPIPNIHGIRRDVLEALKRLKVPNLRWPGGCFADTYHWRDGVGDPRSRPSMVNMHWGGAVEDNSFGTHEFLELCELLGAEPYLCGNVGSGTVREMSQWLEYLTHPGGSPMSDLRRANGRAEPWKVTWWGIGNENYGCGGNMTARQYADEYRKYQTYCARYDGGKLFKIAGGQLAAWNETVLGEIGPMMDGLSIHYYTTPVSLAKRGGALHFDEAHWAATLGAALGMESFLRETEAILDRHDPAGRIRMLMDEWGTWYDVEPGTNPHFLYQQNTIRDAVVAGLTLNLFHGHLPRLAMANIAQVANVLQAMVLTDGARMLRTPTYHVFEMYTVHQEALHLPSLTESELYTLGDTTLPRVSASASRDDTGAIHLSLVNLHPREPAPLKAEIRGAAVGRVTGRLLTGPAMNTHNTFDAPDTVVPAVYTGARVAGGLVEAVLPPRSVTVLEVR